MVWHGNCEFERNECERVSQRQCPSMVCDSQALCKVKYIYIKPKVYTKVCFKKSPIIISPPSQASDIYVLAQVPLMMLKVLCHVAPHLSMHNGYKQLEHFEKLMVPLQDQMARRTSIPSYFSSSSKGHLSMARGCAWRVHGINMA